MSVIAIANLSVGVLMFFISLPLVYRKIPMNYIYGVRIRAAFESDQRWYDINAYGGRQLAAWSWLIIADGVAGFFVPHRYGSIYENSSIAIILLAVLIPMIRVIQWSRRLPPEAAVAEAPQPNPIEIAQTPKTPPWRNLLKIRTLIPAIVFGLLCVGYLIFVAHSAAWLPARVATHFGASGRPNGWMPREMYLHFIAVLGLAAAFSIVAVAIIISIFQDRRSPSRRSGRLSQKRNQNLSWFCGDMLWLACLILCFIAGVHYLTIEANHSHPAHLPSKPFGILIAAFIFGNIGWVILLWFHLTSKPDATDATKVHPPTDLPVSNQN